MYSDTIDHFANLARHKADTLSNRRQPVYGSLAIGSRAMVACVRAPTSAQPLTDKDIADLAAYYASLKP